MLGLRADRARSFVPIGNLYSVVKNLRGMTGLSILQDFEG